MLKPRITWTVKPSIAFAVAPQEVPTSSIELASAPQNNKEVSEQQKLSQDNFLALKSSLITKKSDYDRLQSQLNNEIAECQNNINTAQREIYELRQEQAAAQATSSDAVVTTKQDSPVQTIAPRAQYTPGQSNTPAPASRTQYTPGQANPQPPAPRAQYMQRQAIYHTQTADPRAQYLVAQAGGFTGAMGPRGFAPASAPFMPMYNGMMPVNSNVYNCNPFMAMQNNWMMPVNGGVAPFRPDAHVYMIIDPNCHYLGSLIKLLQASNMVVQAFEPCYQYYPHDIILVPHYLNPAPSAFVYVYDDNKRALWQWLKDVLNSRGWILNISANK